MAIVMTEREGSALPLPSDEPGKGKKKESPPPLPFLSPRGGTIRHRGKGGVIPLQERGKEGGKEFFPFRVVTLKGEGGREGRGEKGEYLPIFLWLLFK